MIDISYSHHLLKNLSIYNNNINKIYTDLKNSSNINSNNIIIYENNKHNRSIPKKNL